MQKVVLHVRLASFDTDANDTRTFRNLYWKGHTRPRGERCAYCLQFRNLCNRLCSKKTDDLPPISRSTSDLILCRSGQCARSPERGW